MATLFITEFAQEGIDALGRVVPAAKQLPVAEQTVAIGASNAQSSALNANTTIVRLHTDSNCHVKFDSNPTATTSLMRMGAGQTEYFIVPAGSSLKVAVIAGA